MVCCLKLRDKRSIGNFKSCYCINLVMLLSTDMLRAVWTSDEVKVLLTRWAEESVQEQLRSTQRNERVFAQLSSELATQGFDKTTSQCRSKIRLLKQKYKRIKGQKVSKKQKSRWFAIMDKVLGVHKPEAETKQAAKAMDSAPASLQKSQHELSETVEDLGKIRICFCTVACNLLNLELTELSCSSKQHILFQTSPTGFHNLFLSCLQPRLLNLQQLFCEIVVQYVIFLVLICNKVFTNLNVARKKYVPI